MASLPTPEPSQTASDCSYTFIPITTASASLPLNNAYDDEFPDEDPDIEAPDTELPDIELSEDDIHNIEALLDEHNAIREGNLHNPINIDSDDELPDIQVLLDEHNAVKKSDSTNPAPNNFVPVPKVTPPTSSLNDKRKRKRAAGEELTGRKKRTGPTGPNGRGTHEFADVSSFFDCLHSEGIDELPRRTFRDTNIRSEAINELIDEAPAHKKDVTKVEMNRYLGSFDLRISPTLVDGDRRWSIKGLKTPLHTHQALGAGRIRHLEKHPQGLSEDGEPQGGGILADQMGLGSELYPPLKRSYADTFKKQSRCWLPFKTVIAPSRHVKAQHLLCVQHH